MRLKNVFIVSISLLSFTLNLSAQMQPPKIVWKNLQEKYESFQEMKPIIKNESNQAVYYDCTFDYADQTEDIRLFRFDEKLNFWSPNVFACGNAGKDEINRRKEEGKRLRKLVKEGRYIPEGCKINPNEEVTLLNQSQLKILASGDGLIAPFVSGKFKIRFQYYWANSLDYEIAESPEFLVITKEEANPTR